MSQKAVFDVNNMIVSWYEAFPHYVYCENADQYPNRIRQALKRFNRRLGVCYE